MSDDYTDDPNESIKNIIDFSTEKSRRESDFLESEYLFQFDLCEDSLNDREWVLHKHIKKDIVSARNLIISYIKKLENLALISVICVFLQIVILFFILYYNSSL